MFAYKLYLLLQNHGWWGFRFSWLFRKVHKSIQKCVWKEYAASYRIMKIAAQGLIVLFGGKEVISGNIWANSPLQMFILLFIAASEHYLFMYEYIKIILLFSTLFNILWESLKITASHYHSSLLHSSSTGGLGVCLGYHGSRKTQKT